MKRLILLFVISVTLGFVSCEREPDCMWCTTVAILPEYGTILGEGYACGQSLEVIQDRQYYWTDPETGELYLVITICKER
jgi:hypothetical protein